MLSSATKMTKRIPMRRSSAPIDRQPPMSEAPPLLFVPVVVVGATGVADDCVVAPGVPPEDAAATPLEAVDDDVGVAVPAVGVTVVDAEDTEVVGAELDVDGVGGVGVCVMSPLEVSRLGNGVASGALMLAAALVRLALLACRKPTSPGAGITIPSPLASRSIRCSSWREATL